MGGLIRVADGAYPHPPYGFLPEDVRVWAGYLGGHTPYAWSRSEIDQAAALVGKWWGIWTAPVGRQIGKADGIAGGAATVARLVELDYPTGDPVFYDIEHSTYVAGPLGATAALAAWKLALAAAGYRHGYGYLPWAAQRDWVANWTGVAPRSLPPGVIGIQYDHALPDGFDLYDLSVFDPALLTGGPEMLDRTDPVVIDIFTALTTLTANLQADHSDIDTRIGTVRSTLGQLAADEQAAHQADLTAVQTVLDVVTHLQGGTPLAFTAADVVTELRDALDRGEPTPPPVA